MTPAADRALDLIGVAKRFDRVMAFDDVSVAIRRGRVLGSLGPNGAGKTVMQAVFGLVEPDAASCCGGTAGRTHRAPRFGHLPEERGLYPRMLPANSSSTSVPCTG